MRERGIIMAAESVRAILAGTKTQTRRVVNTGKFGQGEWDLRQGQGVVTRHSRDGIVFDTPCGRPAKSMQDAVVRCPYGAPGDRLWVKEAWKPLGSDDIAYRASEPDMDGPWKSPLYLTRELSRLTLDVTEVRLQRLQEISEADAVAEGAPEWSGLPQYGPDCYRRWYRAGWDSINGKRGFHWASNPFVWVVTFKRATTHDGGGG